VRRRKHVAENIAEGLGAVTAGASAGGIAAGLDPGMPVLIVDGALLRVRQNFVGFLGFLEFIFGFVIARIAIGVKLHG